MPTEPQPPADAAASGRALYRERLTPPWWGWLLAPLWASTLGIAYGYAINAAVGWTVGLGLTAVALLAIWRMSAVIEVTTTTLRAGRATLPLGMVKTSKPLEAEAARLRRGTGADPRAYVTLRGWVSSAVIVELDDPVDPTPYWYVSSRRPEVLADTIAGMTRSVT
ncbi:MAG: DUF3093 domain-containing protein [Actinomycetes bacterium]